MPSITFEKALEFVIPQVLYLTSFGVIFTGFHTVDTAITHWCKEKMKTNKRNILAWYAFCSITVAIILVFGLAILTSLYNWQIS